MCYKHDPLTTPALNEALPSLVPLRRKGARACLIVAHLTPLEVIWHKSVLLYRCITQKNI